MAPEHNFLSTLLLLLMWGLLYPVYICILRMYCQPSFLVGSGSGSAFKYKGVGGGGGRIRISINIRPSWNTACAKLKKSFKDYIEFVIFRTVYNCSYTPGKSLKFTAIYRRYESFSFFRMWRRWKSLWTISCVTWQARSRTKLGKTLRDSNKVFVVFTRYQCCGSELVSMGIRIFGFCDKNYKILLLKTKFDIKNFTLFYPLSVSRSYRYMTMKLKKLF
jgi:hypothetical protein